MVEVYTTSSCHYCKDVKEYLRGKNVEFKEVDVGNSKVALRKLELITKGKRSVPLTVIGKHALLGFDEKELERILMQEGLIGDKNKNKKEKGKD